ncbi:MAG: murein biosynthesis integral membrane protein MurJ [Desulfobacteraceae bacterium 4572_19]|nr:MAG: murein biosynthesis integral membrane protein MurJ [Desulfobacteraceae bacterium 4572_19]
MQNITQENKKVVKNAGIVGSFTLLSRILGFARDVVIASFFGAGFYTDAFFVAFRVPNLFRRLFAEGTLSLAFIPVFTDYFQKEGKKSAFQLAGAGVKLLSVILVLIVITGIFFSPYLVDISAPGFAKSPEKYALTVLLTRIMFPYLFFICLVALCMGILNALGHFAAPALAPVFLNISMIGSIFFIAPCMTSPIVGLGIGVVIGGILQLVLQVPFLIKKQFYFWKKTTIFHPGVKRVGKLMLPAVIGSAVYQLNIVVGTFFASILSEGSVSYLYYADRLVQFPLALFAISISTAVLPALSKQVTAKKYSDFRETFTYSMRLIFFITLPAIAGLIILREPIIAVLFQRGAFTAEMTKQTASALFCYAVGLWAFSAVRIIVSSFYAMSDAKTPVKMAVISIGFNIIICIILLKPLGHAGIALATSLSSIFNFFLLTVALHRKIKLIEWRNIVETVWRCVLLSLFMGICVKYALTMLSGQFESSLLMMAVKLVAIIIFGISIYITCAYLANSQELKMLLPMVEIGKGREKN